MVKFSPREGRFLYHMLSAKRISDGETVLAYFEQKRNGPFRCLECNEEVILKGGKSRVNHFAHANPLACFYSQGESEGHRACKREIYEALLKEPNVRNVALERAFGTVRPDVSAVINGVPVAIEVQISSLSLDTILRRTIEYFRKGIHVLWLLQWTPKLNSEKYSPRLWERWIHAAYFGRVYYWTDNLEVVSYRFEPSLKSIPKASLFAKNGKKITVGGYTRRSKRHRSAVLEGKFNLITDFAPRTRYWWEGGGLKVPDAKLFMQR